MTVFRITYSNEKPTVYNSKIGGKPYWPEDKDYPEDNDGVNMVFLAQINFAELPENNIFPEEGMLQFFIAKDDTLGLFSDNGYKVVYHPEILESVDVELDDDILDYTPVYNEAKMVFRMGDDLMSYNDYRFDKSIPESEYGIYDTGWGTKLLGYPAFTQWDPREQEGNQKYDTLLFQLDSDDGYVMWGDVGIGNFFISFENLVRRDFSDVLYNWDCY